jgi:phosphoribosylaminoimidazole-succinocarboxamide synthase
MMSQPDTTALPKTAKPARTSMMPIQQPVFATNLPLPDRRQGKVRDIYAVPSAKGEPPRVLIIASDRISAFDVVLPTPIPGKGKLLTEISCRWFELIRSLDIVGDHLVSTDPADVPGLSADQQSQIEGRMMFGRAAQVVPIECVVRGYLAGSGWVDYKQTQSVCGVKLPAGLRRCDRLPEPIFTPATKATVGHDENIDFERACIVAGQDLMERLRDMSISIYKAAASHAESRGIILADTKFEFGFALDAAGRATDELLLIDEALTPDSSRFWPAAEYAPGRDQDSFDKQYVRNYLLELVEAGRWDKTPPGPELPQRIVMNTYARYVEARDRLFG